MRTMSATCKARTSVACKIASAILKIDRIDFTAHRAVRALLVACASMHF